MHPFVQRKKVRYGYAIFFLSSHSMSVSPLPHFTYIQFTVGNMEMPWKSVVARCLALKYFYSLCKWPVGKNDKSSLFLQTLSRFQLAFYQPPKYLQSFSANVFFIVVEPVDCTFTGCDEDPSMSAASRLWPASPHRSSVGHLLWNLEMWVSSGYEVTLYNCHS